MIGTALSARWVISLSRRRDGQRLGSLSIGLSIWDLAVNNKSIAKRSAWDVRSFSDANGKSDVVLSFTRKF
ncbi:hypothetical protein [Dyadobacter sp. OTU695]|uniref:hypothetical protein n=1 Tax=Dyadobacter sp. OTU695 TaxID=3043860 RepID=UPI00313E135A